MIRNLFLARPETIQMLSVLLSFLLSYSPNARSAQTGVADKLMGRLAAHSPTAWFAPRIMRLLSFSICLMGRSAHHPPNARSAQTGVANKLMGRSTAHDPTARAAPRPMRHAGRDP